ncbi:MAG TPA: GNAT family N-acetyltransferase [Burkholderiaceae bacterium]|nr:GNAT family N-acetyltransferase [Burkholderiaceae bacterium]
MPFTLRPATPSDTAQVAAILQAAAAQLAEQGWPLWLPEEVSAERVAADAALGQYYLAFDGEQAVGTMRFQLEDPDFWPEVPAGASAYVHRVAVLPAWAGRGLSSFLLDEACRLAREAGRAALRLDTASDRGALRALYVRYGFVHVDDRQVGRHHVSRYVLALDAAQRISVQTAPHYRWLGIDGRACDGWHLARSTGLSVIQERVPAGAAERPHVHHRAEQFFYILQGAARMALPARHVDLRAGEGLHVPAGVPHQFMNVGDSDVHFLVISTPPTAGDRSNLESLAEAALG